MAEANIRVRLDTRQAKTDLRELGKEGRAAGQRTGGRLGGFTLGAALGAGAAALGGAGRRAFQAGGGGELVSAYTGSFSAMAGGLIGTPKVRANQAGVETAKQVYGYQAGIERKVPQGAVKLRDAVLDNMLPKFEGENRIEQELGLGGEAVKALKESVIEQGKEWKDATIEYLDFLYNKVTGSRGR